ncbi:hypothetical protein [Mesorhizobium australicum]|jgi:NO-binding membrane sensor protein with MHYT domain|uniref:hypothetical protein n=1 Tax=Mesorhizobium australicum TaxID=536018 RepID=UPI001FCCFCED|nr:hypothetical protein [Mesorhizobium australicum]
MGQDTPLGRWVRGLSERTHKNVVVVALAARLARIVWAVLRKERGSIRRSQRHRNRRSSAAELMVAAICGW